VIMHPAAFMEFDLDAIGRIYGVNLAFLSRSYLPLRQGGRCFEEAFDFLYRIEWPPGGPRSTEQTALGESVNSCRTLADGFCGLDPVQREFRN